jgi:predicted  nucleic acid-binding Zn-ribbon protein
MKQLIEEILLIVVFTFGGAALGFAVFSKSSRKNPGYTKEHEYLIKPFKTAKSELRALRFERSLISQTISRIYEAVLEGEIDKIECDRLVPKYKHQFAIYNEKINTLESLIEDLAENVDIHRHNDNQSLSERRTGISQLWKESERSNTNISKKMKVMQPPIPNGQSDDQASDNVAVSEEKEKKLQDSSEEENLEKLQMEVMQALSRLDQIEIDTSNLSNDKTNAPTTTSDDKSCLRQFR